MRFFPRYDGPPLIDQITSVDNLTIAWQRVRSNIKLALRSRSAGLDAVTIRDFEANWTRQMTQLADELRDGSYRSLPARRVAIPKRSGGERAIAILAVRDRVAQRAVQQVLEPLFEPFFLDCAYGCRPGVGVPHAIERVQRYADQGLTWVVDADISSYFDTIDQRIVLGLLRQRIDDLAVLRLVAQWLQGGTVHWETDRLTDTRSLFGRAKQLVQRTFDEDETAAPLPSSPFPDDTFGSSGVWPSDGSEMYAPTSFAPRSGWENKVWTAVMLARPVMRGARVALPYVQRIGGRRLAVAGAVAAGTVAAGEVALRRWSSTGRGTPQGGALSPLLANMYLHPFDLALTSHGYRLVRFVDDFVIMCHDEAEAQAALAFAQRQLARLHLSLNGEKTRVLPYADGLDFLGQALAPRRRGQRLAQGAASFTEAEHKLRAAAGEVRRRLNRRSK
jgi:RNA-directed DNA polymerase